MKLKQTKNNTIKFLNKTIGKGLNKLFTYCLVFVVIFSQFLPPLVGLADDEVISDPSIQEIYTPSQNTVITQSESKGTWENLNEAQNFGSGNSMSFEDFTTTNSAYLLGYLHNTSTSFNSLPNSDTLPKNVFVAQADEIVPADLAPSSDSSVQTEEVTQPIPLEEPQSTTTQEVIASTSETNLEPLQTQTEPQSANETSPELEFSNFTIENLVNSQPLILTQAVLKVSIAGPKNLGGNLNLEYQISTGTWQSLGSINFNEEQSPELNGGDFKFVLPKEAGENVEALKVRFKYAGDISTPSPLVYIKNIRVEAEYILNSSTGPNANSSDEETVATSTFETLEFQNKLLELSMPGDLENPITVTAKNRPAFVMAIKNVLGGSAAIRNGDDIVYENAFKNTDLSYKLTKRGLKENIILKEKNSPKSFKYLLNLNEYDYLLKDDVLKLYKKGHKDEELFLLYKISAPIMTDLEGKTSSEISLDINKKTLTVTPDSNWLASAHFPVTVDPTVEITVINIHSHPITGDHWNIDFVTAGTDNLTITPADQDTIKDMQFNSLTCGTQDVTQNVEVGAMGVLYYPNWSCDDIATVSFLDLKTGNHHMVFDFGGQTADAFNTALVWKGTAGDGSWNNATNWSPAQVPGSSDSVTFDSTCTSCNATIDVNAGITSLSLDSSYTGILTQGSGKTLTTSGSFTIAGGTFVGGDSTISVAGTSGGFSQTGGVFTPTAGTFSVLRDFSYTGGTFNGSGKSISLGGFNNQNGTFSCNGNFNASTSISSVAIVKTINSTFTLASGCTLTADMNSSSGSTITINGTLNTTGNWSSGDVVVNNGTISVPSSTWSSVGSLTQNGTISLANVTSFTSGGINNTTTTTLPSATSLTLNGDFTNGAGAFFSYAGTSFTVKGNWTQNGTFSLTNKSLTISGFNNQNTTFNCSGNFNTTTGISLVSISKSTNSNFTLSSGCNLLADVSGSGGSGNFTINGFLLASSTLNIGNNYTNSGTTTVIGSSGSIGNIFSNSGVFNAPAGTLTVVGNFGNTGTFNHNSGTVNMNNTTDNTISGTTTFYNLTKSVTTAHTLTFTAGTTQTIANTLTLQGASGQKLSLRSSSSGNQYSINPQGSKSVSFVDVKDSRNINSTIINATTNSTDSGNNLNWDFGTTFTQSDFRFYQNTNALQPSVTLGNLSATTTLTSTSSPIRLRINVIASSASVSTTSRTFLLQVATSTSSTWFNIGSTTNWSMFNNSSVTDGATISSTLLASSNVSESYSESNVTAANPNALAIGQSGEWDFVLDPSGATSGSTYFFRLTSPDGSAFNAYTNYPSIVIDGPPNAPTSLGPSSVTDGSWISNSTPNFSFNLTDPDSSDTVKFRIQISTSSSFSTVAIDYVSFLTSQGSNGFTVGQNPLTGTYLTGSQGQTLPDSSGYYWRVFNIDNNGATSSTSTANSGAIAFKIDTASPTPGSLTATSSSSSLIRVTISGASDSVSGLATTSYIFYNLTSVTNSGSTSSASTTFSSLNPNAQYYFIASVTDAAGNVASTASTSIYTLANPPTGLATTTVSQTSIGLSFGTNSNPAGTTYVIENITSATSATTTASSTTISGLVCETSYTFRVKAINFDNYSSSYSSNITSNTSACNNNPNSPTNLGPTNLVSNYPIVSTTPTFTFTLSDPDVADTVGYRILISTTSDFTGLVIDYTSVQASQGNAEFTLGQSLGTYAIGSATTTLVDRTSYYWKVKTVDALSASSAYAVANSGDIAFTVIVPAPTNTGSGGGYGGGSATPNVPEPPLVGPGVDYVPSPESSTSPSITTPPTAGSQTTPPVALNSSTPIINNNPTPQSPSGQEGSLEAPGGQTENSVPTDSALGGISQAASSAGNAFSKSAGEIYNNTKEFLENTIGQVGEALGNLPSLAIDPIKSGSGGARKIISGLNYIASISSTGYRTLSKNADTIQTTTGITTVAVAPTALTLRFVILTSGFNFNISSFSDFWLIIVQIINSFLTWIGFRKRRRHWGTVYDSVTKQPIDPAIVELVEVTDGKPGKVLEQAITDLSGRFGFLERIGQFILRVKKTNYEFPSKIILGKVDGIFSNLYHNEILTVQKTGDVLSPNVPMDAIAFDWNQQDKKRLVKINSKLELLVYHGLNVLFWAGAFATFLQVIIHVTFVTVSLAVIYSLLLVLQYKLNRFKLAGHIKSGTVAIEGLILEASPENIPGVTLGRAVTDENGKFFLKLPKGKFTVKVKRLDGEHVEVIYSTNVEMDREGVFNKDIILA